MWPYEELPCLLYQMLFSLYAAQKELSLRHYDVKLLNFFLCKPTARLSKGFGHETGLPVDAEAATGSEASAILEYGVSGLRHRFRLDDLGSVPRDARRLGTSDISPATLGSLSSSNTTPRLRTRLRLPSARHEAVQDGKADAFALGLCWLHLLTGRAPYEELSSVVAQRSCAQTSRRMERARASAAPMRRVTPTPLFASSSTSRTAKERRACSSSRSIASACLAAR